MPSLQIPNMLIAMDAGKGVQAPMNPLSIAHNLIGIQGQQIANQQGRNALNTYQARVAAGQDFQRSIGPNGQPSQTALNTNLANDPQAAVEAANMSGQGLANQTGLQGIATSELQRHIVRNQVGGQAIASTFADTPTPTFKDVAQAIAAIPSNILTPSEKAGMVSTIPTDTPGATAWAKSKFMQSGANLSALQQHIATLNQGPDTLMLNTNPAAPGAIQPGTQVGMGLSPEGAAQVHSAVDANGTPINYTTAQAAQGQFPASGPNIYHQALQGSYVAQTAQAVQQASSVVSGYPSQISNMATLAGEVANAPQGGTSKIMANVSNAMAGLLPNTGDAATVSQALTKGNAQLAVTSFGSMVGAPTDARQALVESMLPHLGNTTAANETALKLIAGQAAWKYGESQAIIDYAQSTPAGQQNVAAFKAHYAATSLSPLDLSFTSLPPIIQKETLTAIPPSERAAFVAKAMAGEQQFTTMTLQGRQ